MVYLYSINSILAIALLLPPSRKKKTDVSMTFSSPRFVCCSWVYAAAAVCRLQEYVLAGLLIDLSLLDQYMFRFRPGTLASAALFLARVSAIFYSKVYRLY